MTAGANITISGNTISAASGGSSLILQLDGVTQSTNTLNFIGNNALLSGGVLNVSRLNSYDKIPFSGLASIKDLKQGVTGELLWDNQEVQLKINTFQQINAVLPIAISGSNIITIESLWKPSNVTAGAGLWGVASDALGTLSLGVDFSNYSTTTQMNTALALKADDVAVAGGLASVNFANTSNNTTGI